MTRVTHFKAITPAAEVSSIPYLLGLEAQFRCGGLQFVVNAFGQEGSKSNFDACLFLYAALASRVALLVSP